VTTRPQVLVVGGGLGGLAAAWRLSEPGWQRRFSAVTVLEQSTRPGGKAGSARGPDGRIEEHGLHVWLGHYDAAFRIMRECYAELDRAGTDPHCPIRDWQDAFFPAPRVGVFDAGPDGWSPWTASFSGNRALPGDPDADTRFPTVAEMLVRAARLLRDFYASLAAQDAPAQAVSLSATTPGIPARSRLRAARALGGTLVAVSEQLLRLAGSGPARLTGPQGAAAIAAAFAPLTARLARMAARDLASRRLLDLVDVVTTTLVGMVTDGLAADRDAYDSLDDMELRDWLRRHGARPSTLRSPLIRGQYDLAFAYRDGDPARPAVGAGWAVFLSAKLWFDFKGAFFWRMRAGMGEVVVAPLHQALTARGVTFRLEHEVTLLEPAGDGTAIDGLLVRAPVSQPPSTALARVHGLPAYTGPTRTGRPREVRRLARGTDFDALVLAVPPAVSRTAAARLVEQKPAWRAMVDGLGCVATQAFQLWLRLDDRTLGWPHPGSTMSAMVESYDTWASMPHLVEHEDWRGDPPGTVAYFCSSMTRSDAEAADPRARVRDLAVAFLERHSRVFWPNSVDPRTRGFRWDLLVAPDDAAGPERFDAQYWTANTGPSDRYVQALPGTGRLRLRPDGSGYRNLFLAGDWTDCGVNAGCIEAAAVSGLQAANAVLGLPRWHRVPGLHLR
jgi:uncharacterized protein with NAD-binding domain and iron-sulfur cluster